MTWVKRRPSIQLLAPAVVSAGAPFQMSAILDCPAPLPVGAVDIEMLGVGRFDGDQSSLGFGGIPFSRHLARTLDAPRELAPGRHTLAGRFVLPADAPASYRGRRLSIDWTARVHVDIPWWPDARARFRMRVATRGLEPASSARLVYTSREEGPRGHAPYAEVSLASDEIRPGGRIEGRVALANTGHNAYRALRFTLMAEESFEQGIVSATSHHSVGQWRIVLGDVRENEPIPIDLRVPSEITPGFRTRCFGLRWFLVLQPEVAWSIDTKLWIPLRVRTDPEPVQVPMRPLAVGSERLELVWRAAAQQSGYDYVSERLERAVGRFVATIQRDTLRRGRRGLIAEARLGDLDIGLRLHRGCLRARDPGQSEVLAEHTDDAAAACSLAMADDEWLRCETPATGTRIAPIADLARSFASLLEALARAHAELPAPADMQDMVGAFRGAARRLGAELDLASMDIRGHRDEIPFGLETRWASDGALACTELWVRPLLPIDARLHGVWVETDGSDGVPEPLRSLHAGARALEVDRQRLRIELPPRPADLDAVVGRLEELLALAARLSLRGRGYR